MRATGLRDEEESIAGRFKLKAGVRNLGVMVQTKSE